MEEELEDVCEAGGASDPDLAAACDELEDEEEHEEEDEEEIEDEIEDESEEEVE